MKGSTKDLRLINQDYSLDFLHETESLEKGIINLIIKKLDDKKEKRVSVDFRYYKSYVGTNNTDHNEGFYIFKTA